MEEELTNLIYGKSSHENIVSCEVSDEHVELFIEDDKGVRSKFIPNKYWILSANYFDDSWKRLEGDLFYKYAKTYNSKQDFKIDKQRYYNKDTFLIHDEKEAAMLASGFTYFKGMKINDVSVLSFDIETTGLSRDNTSKVLLISNTFRRFGSVVRKLFSFDEYQSQGDLINAWTAWFRSCDPSVIVGHNIFGYDFPYLAHCADMAGTSLELGRDKSNIRFNDYDSKFRFDGSQDYDYKRCYIYGREIVDTFFLSMKYDFGRKYTSYGLKNIIAQEKLEVKDRQFYDAATIKDNYNNPEEWSKIKKYAEHDADDALALYDLMIPSYFYYSQHIPKSFQSIMYSATGSQINSLLVRSYLQFAHSLPKASEAKVFEGAISFGIPGRYTNVLKIDFAALYPSIMRQYKIYDKYKDPGAHFLKLVDFFTIERLKNKKLAKDTNDKYYSDIEQSQKIFINSAYGLLGASGLLFNSPFNAATVTRKARELLKETIYWATSKKSEEWVDLFKKKTK